MVDHGKLGGGHRLGEAGAVADLVLDPGDEVGQRFLALVGGEQGGDFVTGLRQAPARGAADVVDLDDVPAKVGADRPDDGALGGGEGRIGDRVAGKAGEFGAGLRADVDVFGGKAGGRRGGDEGRARPGAGRNRVGLASCPGPPPG